MFTRIAPRSTKDLYLLASMMRISVDPTTLLNKRRMWENAGVEQTDNRWLAEVSPRELHVGCWWSKSRKTSPLACLFCNCIWICAVCWRRRMSGGVQSSKHFGSSFLTTCCCFSKTVGEEVCNILGYWILFCMFFWGPSLHIWKW